MYAHITSVHTMCVCVPYQQVCVGLSATSQDPQPPTTASPQKPDSSAKVNPLRAGKHQ